MKTRRLTRSSNTINRELSKLRKIIEQPGTATAEMRIAQAAEHALRWSTEHTRGWKSPADEVKLLTTLL